MEQIIPILIAAVVFGFQAYANYQKEQEKARKRQQSKPVNPRETGSDEVLYDDTPFPDNYLEELMPEAIPESGAPAQRPVADPGAHPVPNPYGKYQGALRAEEARRLTSRQRPSQQSTHALEKRVELTDLGDDDKRSVGSNATILDLENLDLRQAVIHSIILERPYRY